MLLFIDLLKQSVIVSPRGNKSFLREKLKFHAEETKVSPYRNSARHCGYVYPLNQFSIITLPLGVNTDSGWN